MKPKLILWFAVAIFLAAGAGWLAGSRSSVSGVSSGGGERRVQFYQDSMHPWIKSETPGKCTICGMDLTPVHEGEQGMEAGDGLIMLTANNINVANVRTVRAEPQKVRKTLRLAGAIAAADDRRVYLSARADGEIVKLLHDNLLGRVDENTPLAILSSKAVFEAQREFIELSRGDNLEKITGGEKQRERLLNAARARLEQFGFSEDQINELPERSELASSMEVRTPIAGTVTNRQVYEGMAVKEGHRMFEVVDFSTVWFKFDCYEGDMAWIAPGLEMEISTPAAPGKLFKGKITFLEPSIGHMVRSIKGRAELENPLISENGRERRLLRERELAEGILLVEVASELTVPRAAVLSPGTESVVYVEKDKGTYERRVVSLGRVGDQLIEVTGGLSEGDMVVTNGNLLIDSQAEINRSGVPDSVPNEETLVTEVTEDQQLKASGMFGIAVSMGSALARDNLSQYNLQVAAIENALLPFIQAFSEQPLLKDHLSKLEGVAHLKAAADLAEARKGFLAFSNSLVGFAKAVRQIDAFGYLQIYHCPMADDAVPGGPKDGFWIQAAPPLRNPFFGAAMLGCGIEVKAPAASGNAKKADAPGAQPAPQREILSPAGDTAPAPAPKPYP